MSHELFPEADAAAVADWSKFEQSSMVKAENLYLMLNEPSADGDVSMIYTTNKVQAAYETYKCRLQNLPDGGANPRQTVLKIQAGAFSVDVPSAVRGKSIPLTKLCHIDLGVIVKHGGNDLVNTTEALPVDMYGNLEINFQIAATVHGAVEVWLTPNPNGGGDYYCRVSHIKWTVHH